MAREITQRELRNRSGEPRHRRGIVDTSVVIDLQRIGPDARPSEVGAVAAGLRLYARSPEDFAALDDLLSHHDANIAFELAP